MTTLRQLFVALDNFERFKGQWFTICTAKLTRKILPSTRTVHLCVLYGSQGKQRLCLYTELTLWRRNYFFLILAYPVYKM